jgi:ABC-type branched-subunit amino acid transport system substrate-binding protein
MRKGILCLAALLLLGSGAAQAQEPYVIGLTGDLSGPAAGTYKALAEGARVYIDALNARGGIKGHPVKLVTRDSRSDPNQVVADLNFFEAEKVIGLFFVSPSGTLGAFVRQNKTSQIPTVYINACYPPATPPQPDPNFFCPGVSTLSDALVFVDILQRNMGSEKIKLGFVTTDIPGARGAAERIMKPRAEANKIEVTDVAVMPLGSSDATAIARSLMDKGTNAVISYTISSHMLAGAEAFNRLGWKGKYFLFTGLPGTFDQLRQLKSDNIYGLDHFSALVENKPVHKEIRAAAAKHGFDFPLDDIRFGYRGGMVLAAALDKCGWPCDREKLRATLGNLTVDSKDMVDLNLNPVIFSATNHTSPKKAYRVYHWSNQKNNIEAVGELFTADERDWK